MKLEAILMANAATIDASSLLTVEGSGWRFVERATFPETVGGCVCGLILVEDEDFRVRQQRGGQAEPLSHAEREPSDPAVPSAACGWVMRDSLAMRARPKSRIFAVPRAVIMMFAGLMSR